MRTIIDNNVFYGIYLGHFDINEINVTNPIITNSNIDEFARSYNLIYKTEVVRGALRSAMRLSQNKLIGKNPYMYALELDGKYLSLTDHDKNIMDLTQQIAEGFEITEDNKVEILNYWIKQRETELNDIANIFNEWFNNIKSNKRFDKKKVKVVELVEFIKNFLDESIRSWTKNQIGNEVGLSKGFNWYKLDLFLHSFAAFFRSNLTDEGKFKPHDAYDLHQLIYVQPGDKFWTKEKKWQNIIFEKAKKGEYLFEYQRKILKDASNST